MEQDAAQPQKIARYLEIDDLARAVRLNLARADPAGRENIRGLVGLALVHQIPPGDEGSATTEQSLEHRELRLGQCHEGGELSGERAVLDGVQWALPVARDDDGDLGAGTAFDQCSLPPFQRRWRSESGSRMVLISFPKEGRPEMPDQTDYSGMAALSICEALLLAMNDHGLLPEREIMGVLQDAAATHENAVGPDVDKNMHEGVADVINRIIAGGNSVRRP